MKGFSEILSIFLNFKVFRARKDFFKNQQHIISKFTCLVYRIWLKQKHLEFSNSFSALTNIVTLAEYNKQGNKHSFTSVQEYI